jgi:hypothetical protein
MKATTLYKKDCEPYVVSSQEALTFHLNQGWVEDEADVEVETAVVPLTKPYNVLVDGATPVPVNNSGEIKSLKEALVAKDQQIADLTTDFEEVITGLNATIARLKGDGPADFGLPVVPPVAPVAKPSWTPPEGPTNQQLRDQLDAAGIKHTPRDNKTALTEMVAAIPKSAE